MFYYALNKVPIFEFIFKNHMIDDEKCYGVIYTRGLALTWIVSWAEYFALFAIFLWFSEVASDDDDDDDYNGEADEGCCESCCFAYPFARNYTAEKRRMLFMKYFVPINYTERIILWDKIVNITISYINIGWY